MSTRSRHAHEMALDRLPVEILHMIARESIPESYESLMLTNKRIYTTSKPLLKEYADLRKFRRFGYGGSHRSSHGWHILSPMQLMYEIAQNPKIARAIEFADLSDHCADYLYWHLSDDEDIELYHDWEASGFAAVVGRLFEENQVARNVRNSPDFDFDWFECVQELHALLSEGELQNTDLPDLANLFVLALLPNVKRLAVGSRFVRFSENGGDWPLRMKKIFTHIAESAKHGGALSQLRELMQAWSKGTSKGESELPISGLCGILILPTVEVCTQTTCIAVNYGDPEDNWIPRHRREQFPGMRQLNFQYSVLGIEEIEDITSRMPRLEVLRLDFRTHRLFNDRLTQVMHFDSFVEALGRGAGDRLRSFSLTPGDLDVWMSPLRSFRCLEALSELEVACDLFHGGWLLDSPEQYCAVDEFPQLVHALPPSLQRWRLFYKCENIPIEMRKHILLKLFEGFGAEYATALPNLEVIEFICDDNEIDMRRWTSLLKDLKADVPILQIRRKPGFTMKSLAEPLPDWFANRP